MKETQYYFVKCEWEVPERFALYVCQDVSKDFLGETGWRQIYLSNRTPE